MEKGEECKNIYCTRKYRTYSPPKAFIHPFSSFIHRVAESEAAICSSSFAFVSLGKVAWRKDLISSTRSGLDDDSAVRCAYSLSNKSGFSSSSPNKYFSSFLREQAGGLSPCILLFFTVGIAINRLNNNGHFSITRPSTIVDLILRIPAGTSTYLYKVSIPYEPVPETAITGIR
jgi:hypothetical protein